MQGYLEWTGTLVQKFGRGHAGGGRQRRIQPHPGASLHAEARGRTGGSCSWTSAARAVRHPSTLHRGPPPVLRRRERRRGARGPPRPPHAAQRRGDEEEWRWRVATAAVRRGGRGGGAPAARVGRGEEEIWEREGERERGRQRLWRRRVRESEKFGLQTLRATYILALATGPFGLVGWSFFTETVELYWPPRLAINREC